MKTGEQSEIYVVNIELLYFPTSSHLLALGLPKAVLQVLVFHVGKWKNNFVDGWSQGVTSLF